MSADRGNVGQYSTENWQCKVVSCGEVSRVRKIYHRGVKKLCSSVGFEQRCTVRRKVHIAEMSVRGCILTAISILGFGNTD